jgi:hypothetical protein
MPVIFMVYMTILQNLTADQLRKAISIKEQIESLQAQLAVIGDDSPVIPVSAGGRGTYKRSKTARMAMAVAQRERWEKLKGTNEEVAPKKRRKMSAVGRAKIAAAARARWAKAKAAGNNRL